MSNDADPFLTYDGAYVLGALSVDDRVAYEAHLEGCAECSAAVADLRALTTGLAGVPAAAFAPQGEAPPDTLLPGLLRRARRRRVVRRWTVAAVAAAAAAILVVTAGVIGYERGTPTAEADASVMTATVDVPVTARVSVTAAPSGGAVVSMWCAYAGATASRADYVLLVRTTSGGVERLAAWPGTPGQTFMARVPTQETPNQIASVEITNAEGKTLLRYTPQP